VYLTGVEGPDRSQDIGSIDTVRHWTANQKDELVMQQKSPGCEAIKSIICGDPILPEYLQVKTLCRGVVKSPCLDPEYCRHLKEELWHLTTSKQREETGLELGPRFQHVVEAIVEGCRPIWEQVSELGLGLGLGLGSRCRVQHKEESH